MIRQRFRLAGGFTLGGGAVREFVERTQGSFRLRLHESYCEVLTKLREASRFSSAQIARKIAACAAGGPLAERLNGIDRGSVRSFYPMRSHLAFHSHCQPH